MTAFNFNQIDFNTLFKNISKDTAPIDNQITQFIEDIQYNAHTSSTVETAKVMSQGLIDVVAVQRDAIATFNDDFKPGLSEQMKAALEGKLVNVPTPSISAPPSPPTPTSSRGGMSPGSS